MNKYYFTIANISARVVLTDFYIVSETPMLRNHFFSDEN